MKRYSPILERERERAPPPPTTARKRERESKEGVEIYNNGEQLMRKFFEIFEIFVCMHEFTTRVCVYFRTTNEHLMLSSAHVVP